MHERHLLFEQFCDKIPFAGCARISSGGADLLHLLKPQYGQPTSTLHPYHVTKIVVILNSGAIPSWVLEVAYERWHLKDKESFVMKRHRSTCNHRSDNPYRCCSPPEFAGVWRNRLRGLPCQVNSLCFAAICSLTLPFISGIVAMFPPLLSSGTTRFVENSLSLSVIFVGYVLWFSFFV